MKRWIIAALLACAPLQAAWGQPFQAGAQLEGTAFFRGLATARREAPVRYYLAPSQTGPRPLLLVLQGSGCGPLFGADGSATAGQDIVQQFASDRFAVLVVEKPNVTPESADSSNGETGACGADFNRAHSLETWTAAVSRAVDAALRDPRVERRAGVRVMGLSEGAIVSARLARERRDVNHVAFISGFGCDQWRDMLVVARRRRAPARDGPILRRPNTSLLVELRPRLPRAGSRAIASTRLHRLRHGGRTNRLPWRRSHSSRTHRRRARCHCAADQWRLARAQHSGHAAIRQSGRHFPSGA